jgi:uncharacterized protein (TIGR00251 family)
MSLKLTVTVKTQAKKENVTKIRNGELVVSVHAPARDGKANQALVRLLANHFSVAKSDVRILHGHSSRKKLVSIGMS